MAVTVLSRKISLGWRFGHVANPQRHVNFWVEAGEFGFEAGEFGAEAGEFGFEAGEFGAEAGEVEAG